MTPVERRSERNRRGYKNRRDPNDLSYRYPDRRSGRDRRTGTDRRRAD